MNESNAKTQKVLTITEDNAKKTYNEGCNDVKRVLENLFGKKTFVPENVRDQIKNFGDIIVLSGVEPSEYVQKKNETADEFAYRQAKLIASVYNQGEVLDPANTNQYKYFPWHKIVKDPSKPSGFGLSFHDYVSWDSYSDVGVRLCFVRMDDAIDAGKKFIEIYENLKIR